MIQAEPDPVWAKCRKAPATVREIFSAASSCPGPAEAI